MEVHNIVQEVVIKSLPKKKKCKKVKRLSEEALQIAVKRREVKSNGEKERYKYLNGPVVFPPFFNLSLNLAIRSS